MFSLENYQGVGGGCGLEFTSKNLGHTHCHIKGIWMQKTWGPPTPKGPGENTDIYIYLLYTLFELTNQIAQL